MKALNLGSVPSGTWQCEIKFDGYRALALVGPRGAELWSRNHKPMSADYPEIVAALGKLRSRGSVIDGEIVALDNKGRSRFQLLQNRETSGGRPTIVYYVFDLVQDGGESLLDSPLEERRRRLSRLVRKGGALVQLSPAFRTEPATLLEAARRQGLEGIIAKRTGSKYEPGRRSGAWVKCKVLAEQEFVVGGFTPPQRSREHFGALLVGYHKDGKLLYAGKVGTGFDRAQLATLHGKFLRALSPKCPFGNLPMEGRPRFGAGMGRTSMANVSWLRPRFVAQVRFAEWTQDGLLRQPVFLGLRMDKSAGQVRREAGPV